MIGKAVLRNAAANGDANLYLRNIIYYVSQGGNLDKINNLIGKIFDSTKLSVDFNPDNDTDIIVNVVSGGKLIPIELCGTGLLQVIQIMAYSIYFQPKLLLLDEPDEHLHPNNQILLCKALKLLVEEYNLQIILSTHSRHIISAMEGDAKYIWMKNGEICKEKIELTYYNLLFDLGALDTFDDVIRGKYRNIVLTEDSDITYMQTLLKANNIDLNTTLIYPYKTCEQLESAILVGDFIKKAAPNCNVIIHRDRDFMTDDEVNVIKDKITAESLIPWITRYSDIEAYFTTEKHLSIITGKDLAEINSWLTDILTKNHVDIQAEFQNKRNNVKNKLYRDGKLKKNNSISWPDTINLFGKSVPTSLKNVKGKFLLRKINGSILEFAGKVIKVATETEALKDSDIQTLFVHNN